MPTPTPTLMPMPMLMLASVPALVLVPAALTWTPLPLPLLPYLRSCCLRLRLWPLSPQRARQAPSDPDLADLADFGCEGACANDCHSRPPERIGIPLGAQVVYG